MDYKLKKPITLGERTVYELHTHRPTLGDLCAVGASPIGSAVTDRKLLSSLTGEPESILNKIDCSDWAFISVELGKIWKSFFKAEDTDEGEGVPDA